MNFNIYINEEIGHKLEELAKRENKSRNLIIREALDYYLRSKEKKSWPHEVMNFQGACELAQAFESFREELLPPPEKKIF